MPGSLSVSVALLPLVCCLQSPPALPTLGAGNRPPPGIHHLLDGTFDDWRVLDPLSTRIDRPSERGGPDFVVASMTADERFAWVYLQFSQVFSIQSADATVQLTIDSDGDPNSGATAGPLRGADLAILFSPEGEPGKGGKRAPGRGVSVRIINDDGSLGESVPSESLAIGMAPSHASDRFEFRFDRTDKRFAGMSWAMVPSVWRTLDDGTVATIEQLEVIRCLVPPRDPSVSAKASAESIARTEGTAMRVVSWNAELGELFKQPEPFAATLSALHPDVVLFQELGKASGDELRSWLDTHLAGETPWQVVTSGGDLRTAVASRSALSPAPFLDGLKRSTPQGDRDVRVAGAIVQRDGRSILAISVHLKCCGRYQSSEDATRLAEADAINSAIRQAKAKARDAGVPLGAVVIGGDFNLVGDRVVVERMGKGIDVDGSALEVVDATQLDGLNRTTWRRAGDQFLPGRLDWLLFSDASLVMKKAFVFSEEDLSSDAIAALGLPASALQEPSDHQPVVLDVAFGPAIGSPPPPLPTRNDGAPTP